MVYGRSMNSVSIQYFIRHPSEVIRGHPSSAHIRDAINSSRVAVLQRTTFRPYPHIHSVTTDPAFRSAPRGLQVNRTTRQPRHKGMQTEPPHGLSELQARRRRFAPFVRQ
jgi:hypothetical protein